MNSALQRLFHTPVLGYTIRSDFLVLAGISRSARHLSFGMSLSFAQTWAVNLDSGSVGSDWISIPGTDSTAINTAAFFSPTKGFGFGSNGAIVKYNTNVIGISQHVSVPTRNNLGQNYPNPFNPKTQGYSHLTWL